MYESGNACKVNISSSTELEHNNVFRLTLLRHFPA